MEKMPGVTELVRLLIWNLVPSCGCYVFSIQIERGRSKQISAISMNMRRLELLQRLKFRMPVVIVLSDGNGCIRRRYCREKSGRGRCFAAVMAYL